MTDTLERIRLYRHAMEMASCHLRHKATELADLAHKADGLPMRSRLDVRSAIRQCKETLAVLEQMNVEL